MSEVILGVGLILQTTRVCLAIWLLTLMFPVHAETEQETSVDELTETKQNMLRQQGQVEGYMTLPLADEEFAATFVEDKTGKNYGKVLILPDAAGDIDSRDLVHTLRAQLPDAGWSTMTVNLTYSYEPQVFMSESGEDAGTEGGEAVNQVDTTDAEAEGDAEADTATTDFDINSARVSAAIAYLNAQAPGPIVVIMLGESSNLAASVMTQAGENNGLIWINSKWEPADAPVTDRLLDIIPSTISDQQLTQFKRRAVQLRKDIEVYSQRQIAGATAEFYGYEDYLFVMVRNWLHKHYAEGETS